jgi:hypothetical protein
MILTYIFELDELLVFKNYYVMDVDFPLLLMKITHKTTLCISIHRFKGIRVIFHQNITL